ncbi:MAG: pseudouridine synthase [Prosthecobacter sp.]
MRLNRYLSQCGVASRRGAEEIILAGRVSINGHVIKELATQVQPDDKVVVDGSPVRTETPVVIALNKPKGYLCSRGDTHERMTIYDLLPLKYQNLHHVGRLDKESEGLILMTNRGDLSHRLIHPSQGAEKEYEVVVDQAMTPEVMAKLTKGMMTEEGFARAERAWLDTDYRAHIVLKMGLKRQIRMMLYNLGYEVVRLTRIRIGWMKLHGLAKGAYKELTSTEIERFFKEETAKPRLARKPATRKTSEPEEEPRSFKSTRPRKSGPAARSASRFKPQRSDETARDGTPRGRSGPPARRPAPRGPRRGPTSR